MTGRLNNLKNSPEINRMIEKIRASRQKIVTWSEREEELLIDALESAGCSKGDPVVDKRLTIFPNGRYRRLADERRTDLDAPVLHPYEFLGLARAQVNGIPFHDMDVAILYREVEDDTWWFRRPDEFFSKFRHEGER